MPITMTDQRNNLITSINPRSGACRIAPQLKSTSTIKVADKKRARKAVEDLAKFIIAACLKGDKNAIKASQGLMQNKPITDSLIQNTLCLLLNLKKRYEVHYRVSISDAVLFAASRLSSLYFARHPLPGNVEKSKKRMRKVSIFNKKPSTAVKEEEKSKVGDNPSDSDGASETPNEVKSEANVEEADSTAEKHSDSAEKNHKSTEEKANDTSQKVDVADTPVSEPAVKKEELESTATSEQQPKQNFQERVIDHDVAIKEVMDCALKSKAGMSKPSQPIGSFLFVDPCENTKTPSLKILFSELFDIDGDNHLWLDMSQDITPESVMRKISSLPGDLDKKEKDQQLPDARRRCPYNILLFDKIDQAPENVGTLLFNILDSGFLTDNKDCTVDFTNTVIIFISNTGADFLPGLTESSTTTEEKKSIQEKVTARVRDQFSAEFLNHLSAVVMSISLSPEEAQTSVQNVMIDMAIDYLDQLDGM